MRKLLLTATLAGALTLAGCSGSGDDDAATTDPAVTATRPPASSAAAPTSVAATKPPAEGRTGVKVSAKTLAAAFTQAAADAGSMSFSVVSTGAQPMDANGSASGSGPQSDMQFSAKVSGANDVQIVRKSGTVYLKPPAPIAAGKIWLAVSDSKQDPFRAYYQQLYQGFASTGDLAVTSRAISRMGTFTAAGTETVDGVRTTKYVARPPAVDGIGLLPASATGLSRRSLAGGRSLVSLWVDGRGLLRRTATIFTSRSGESSKSVTSYQGWGDPVTVSAPPAAQVFRTS